MTKKGNTLDAQNAAPEVQKAPETEPGVFEKAEAFVTKGYDKVVEEFQEGSVLKKTAIIAAGIGGGYLAFELIKQMAKALGSAVESVTDAGKWVSEKLMETSKGTVLGILGVMLGGATAKILYEEIKDEVSFKEISETWKTGGVAGVGLLLGRKQALGLIKISKRTRDAVASKLGIPSWGSTASEGKEKNDENDEEWIPVSDALKNYRADLERAFIPIQNFVSENRKILSAVAAAYGVTHIHQVMSGLKFTKEKLVGFASLLMKHPFKSLLLVQAFLISGEIVRVPKDYNALKKFLGDTKGKMTDFLSEYDLPGLSDEQVDFVARVLSGKIGQDEVRGLMASVGSDALNALKEYVKPSPRTIIQKENINGLGIFARNIRVQFDSDDDKANLAIEKILSIKTRIHNQLGADRDSSLAVLTEHDISQIQELCTPLKIKIEKKGNYYQWGRVNPDGTWTEENALMNFSIDPSLSESEQHTAAKRMQYSSGRLNTVLAASGFAVEEAKEDVLEIVDHIVNGEGTLLFQDGAWMFYAPAYSRLIQVPYEVISQIPKGKLDVKELLFSYAEGLVPVVVVGTLKSLVTGQNPFRLTLLAESAAYPYQGMKFIGQRIFRPFLNGGVSAVFDAVSLRATAGLKTTKNSFMYALSIGTSPQVKGSRQNIRYLSIALEEVLKMEDSWSNLAKDIYIKNIKEALDFPPGLKGITDGIEGKSPAQIIRLIQDRIALEGKMLLGEAKGFIKTIDTLDEGLDTLKKMKDLPVEQSSSMLVELQKKMKGVLPDTVHGWVDNFDVHHLGQIQQFLETTKAEQKALIAGLESTGMMAKAVAKAKSYTGSTLKALGSLREWSQGTGAYKWTGEMAEWTTTASKSAEEILKAKKAVGLREINQLRKLAQNAATVADVEGALRASLQGADGVTNLDDAVKAAMEALKNEKDIAKVVSVLDDAKALKLTTGARSSLNALKGLPLVGTAVIAGLSYFESRQSFEYAQQFKDNPDVRAILESKGYADLYLGVGANATLDLAAYFGAFSSAAAGKYVLAGGVYTAAAAIAVISGGIEATKYMYKGAMDAKAEVAMKSTDYLAVAQRKGPQELLHLWFSTGDDVGAGERYAAVFSVYRDTEFYVQERLKTRSKIVEALLMMGNENQPPEYKGYRMKYIESQTYHMEIPTYQKAHELLARSAFFADQMKIRDRTLQLETGPGKQKQIYLPGAEYDYDRITSPQIMELERAFRAQDVQALHSLLGKEKFLQIDAMDKNYLLHAANVILSHLVKAERSMEAGEFEKWKQVSEALINRLRVQGMVFEYQNIEHPEEEFEKVNKLFSISDVPPQELEKLKGPYHPRSKGVAALYEMAKYFGYQGPPQEESLKQMFSESNASIFGVYWNGEEWMVNDENGSDEEMGTDLDTAMQDGYVSHGIINEFLKDSDDIFASRFDYALQFGQRDDRGKRNQQAQELGLLMKTAYENFIPLKT